MLPSDRIVNLQADIARGFLEVLTGQPAKPTPEQIADRAYRETTDVPSFSAADRFHVVISRINRTEPNLSDDDQAAVILACRRRCGLLKAG